MARRITTLQHELWSKVTGGWSKGPVVEIKTNRGRVLRARKMFLAGWETVDGERIDTDHDRHYHPLRHERVTHWRDIKENWK